MAQLSSRWGRRTAATLATTLTTGSLVVAGLGLTSSPAHAVVDARPAQIAGNWIAGQLTGGVAVGGFGADIGLSIDAGLAFDAFGRTADAGVVADGIAPALVTTAEFEYGYAKSTEYDFDTHASLGDGKYANATAKAAAFTQRIGRNPSTAYSPDIDLLAQLEELTSDATGEIADDSSFESYANTIGQAFAVEALTVAGSAEAAAATSALLLQQCPAGYFRLELSATACADGTDTPHPDVTALAVLSLVESGSSAPTVTEAIAKATTWFASVQGADGSFAGEATTPGSNSNTTGLAGWALGAAGRTAAATKAAAWTRARQAADTGACASLAPTGALAYNDADLAKARTEGVTSLTRDKWRRTTFQAAPVLNWAPAATAPLAISAPATAVEKSTVTVTVAGLGAGEAGCVTLGSVAKPVTGTGGNVAVAFDLPAGVAAHTFTLTTLAGALTATTNATLTPVPATPEVGKLKASKVETVKNNRFKLAVACDDDEACDGTIVVRTTRKVRIGDAKARKFLISTKSYSVEPGTTEKVVLKVRKPARAALDSGRIRVKAVQAAKGADRAVTKFWLRRR